MKKAIRLSLILLESALILILFSGCWNYHELETYSVVAGMAIDKGQNGYQYHVTFECMKMTGGGQGAQIEPLLIEEDGNTIFEAVRSTLRESDKKLYFNHCHIVILSSDIAKEGLKSVTDWIQRDAEPRLTMDVLVSKEKTAGEILRVKPQTGELLSYQIDNTLAESASYYGSSAGVQLYQMTDTLNAEGISLVLPAIEKKKSEDEETVQLAGGAVFKGDRMTGWLAAEPVKYVALVRGNLKGGLIQTGPTPGSTQFTLEILESETKVKPVVSGESVTVNIDIKMRTAFGEQDSEKDLLAQLGISKVENYADQTIQYETARVVKDVQRSFNSDIFGFGNTIYQNQPNEWEKISSKWDDIFKTLKVKVTAEVKIENTALNMTKDGI
ncbi:Ger(x)C family spore germination protein [Caproiciproducens sp. NJN-50]|uniref:Ger(x)C family spore germination protein n=1 Tax=Caproiciproducens sp. NJN-50 TaxID=2507162 RepID=UPI000FFE1410|nr:Ger(x)C family spore germination protein [Caproiciproducens sp. NJN-50]QAT51114.1 Ger(x)C family spore germination protein [Caproiciproducens sp. NJN-50]